MINLHRRMMKCDGKKNSFRFLQLLKAKFSNSQSLWVTSEMMISLVQYLSFVNLKKLSVCLVLIR